MTEDCLMNEQIKNYTDLMNRTTFREMIYIPDPDRMINAEVIELLWVYFRVTDPFSLEKYPNISHLRERFFKIKPDLISKYRYLYPAFKNLWIEFLKQDKSIINFMGTFREDTKITFTKNGDSFTIIDEIPADQIYQEILNFAHEISQSSGYYGHMILSALGTFD